MSDMEQDVKEALHGMAEEVRPAPTMPPPTLRRARRGAIATFAAVVVGLGLAVFGIVVGAHAISGRPPVRPATSQTPPVSPPIGEVNDLRAITFVDDRHGWAAGAGEIIATSDGGATWTRQYSGRA